MSALSDKLKKFVFGPPNGQKAFQNLKAADVPVTTADCRSCTDPCEDHDNYPSKMEIDMDSEMLGSVKPYRRQVVISTGKSDWASDITEEEKSLASFLSAANSLLDTSTTDESSKDSSPPGVFSHTEAGTLAILNGSHKPFSDDDSQETVIILPDFKIVSSVPCTPEGAQALWKAALDPSFGRAGARSRTDELKTWVLPYSCLILLCSHKRRDKRCSIVAPILEKTFTQYLEREGWEVHTDLQDVSSDPSLESQTSPDTDMEQLIETQLKSLHVERKALILMNSHIGGHKFAGNCIIYTPRGAGVWYGRVTPHEVESIVKHTIIGGQVLPAILRGGMDLACRGKMSLYDW